MSNERKDVKLHILVEPSLAESLKAESAETGAPVSEIVRRALAVRQNFASASQRRPVIQPSFIPVKETR